MSTYVIDPPKQPALPVAGTSQLFPVRRLYCVGRNYAEHTREMGHDPDKEPPFFERTASSPIRPARKTCTGRSNSSLR